VVVRPASSSSPSRSLSSAPPRLVPVFLVDGSLGKHVFWPPFFVWVTFLGCFSHRFSHCSLSASGGLSFSVDSVGSWCCQIRRDLIDSLVGGSRSVVSWPGWTWSGFSFGVVFLYCICLCFVLFLLQEVADGRWWVCSDLVCSYISILVYPGVEIGFHSLLMLERARCVEASVLAVVFFDRTSRLYLMRLLYAPLVDCVEFSSSVHPSIWTTAKVSRSFANSCFGSYLVGLTWKGGLPASSWRGLWNLDRYCVGRWFLRLLNNLNAHSAFSFVIRFRAHTCVRWVRGSDCLGCFFFIQLMYRIVVSPVLGFFLVYWVKFMPPQPCTSSFIF